MESDVIICGDCLEVMKGLPDNSVDLVLTDPPYPDYYAEEYTYKEDNLNILLWYNCRQIVFWSAKEEFPFDYTAIHIWDKKCGCGSMYERLFERNGRENYKVYRYYLVNSTVAASYTGDQFTEHPSQKPIGLMLQLVCEFSKPNDLILDPFCGSGTTCVAAKMLGRRYIGIDISEKYCDIARKRIAAAEKGITVKELERGQGVLF